MYSYIPAASSQWELYITMSQESGSYWDHDVEVGRVPAFYLYNFKTWNGAGDIFSPIRGGMFTECLYMHPPQEDK